MHNMHLILNLAGFLSASSVSFCVQGWILSVSLDYWQIDYFSGLIGNLICLIYME